jgi:hypothetical protein
MEEREKTAEVHGFKERKFLSEKSLARAERESHFVQSQSEQIRVQQCTRMQVSRREWARFFRAEGGTN